MTSLDDLLSIQELDTTVDQLRHRRSTVPQLAARAALEVELAQARSAVETVQGELHSVRSSEKECEDHASLIEDKAREVQASLYDGSVTAHKELESLQAELAQLSERQREFEDRAIELMEQAEPLEEAVERASAARDEISARIDQLSAEITVAQAEIDVEVDDVTARRAALVPNVPAELIEAYEPLRQQLGGIAVARLSGARCEGCHLEIPSAQLESIRHAPADDLVTCPECFRILVR